MKEDLYNANDKGMSTVRRAFKWLYLIRSFPKDSIQILDREMIDNTVSIFTDGRAEFYHEEERRDDRVPGTFSKEADLTDLNGNFIIKYTEDTSRICIPAMINKGKIPTVKKIILDQHSVTSFSKGFKCLICVGKLRVNEKIFEKYNTVQLQSDSEFEALEKTILLDFTDA